MNNIFKRCFLAALLTVSGSSQISTPTQDNSNPYRPISPTDIELVGEKPLITVFDNFNRGGQIRSTSGEELSHGNFIKGIIDSQLGENITIQTKSLHDDLGYFAKYIDDIENLKAAKPEVINASFTHRLSAEETNLMLASQKKNLQDKYPILNNPNFKITSENWSEHRPMLREALQGALHKMQDDKKNGVLFSNLRQSRFEIISQVDVFIDAVDKASSMGIIISTSAGNPKYYNTDPNDKSVPIAKLSKNMSPVTTAPQDFSAENSYDNLPRDTEFPRNNMAYVMPSSFSMYPVFEQETGKEGLDFNRYDGTKKINIAADLENRVVAIF